MAPLLRSAAVALGLALFLIPALHLLKSQGLQPQFTEAGPARLK